MRIEVLTIAIMWFLVPFFFFFFSETESLTQNHSVIDRLHSFNHDVNPVDEGLLESLHALIRVEQIN